MKKIAARIAVMIMSLIMLLGLTQVKAHAITVQEMDREIYEGFLDYVKEDGMLVVSDMQAMMYSEYKKNGMDLYYLIADLNGDGREELLIKAGESDYVQPVMYYVTFTYNVEPAGTYCSAAPNQGIISYNVFTGDYILQSFDGMTWREAGTIPYEQMPEMETAWKALRPLMKKL